MRRNASLLLTLLAPVVLGAQTISTDPARPGRAADQPIDTAYTRKIREYTTEPFFLSPLVDYLPASATVPTPKAVLGDIAGARRQPAVFEGGLRLHAACSRRRARA